MTSTLPSSPRARLSGHSGPIHALTYSSGNSQYLLSGSSDRSIKLWNPAKAIEAAARTSNPSPTTPPIQTYSGAHTHEVLSLAVSSDNARFASSGGDKSLFVWDVATTKVLRRCGGGVGSHGGKIESVKFGAEADAVVVSGSYDATVRLWDMKAQGQRPMMVLQDAKDSVTEVTVVGWEIGAACVDGRVRWYDLRMGLCFVDVVGVPVTSLTPTLQADSMLVSTLDSKLRLLDKSNGKLLQSYSTEGYINTTYRIRSALGANDSLAISGSEDGNIYAWDVVSGELVGRVQHGADQPPATKSSRKVVSAIACNRRTGDWASAGGDGTVVVWGQAE